MRSVASGKPAWANPSRSIAEIGPGRMADGEWVPHLAAPNLFDIRSSADRLPMIGSFDSGMSATIVDRVAPGASTREASTSAPGIFPNSLGQPTPAPSMKSA